MTSISLDQALPLSQRLGVKAALILSLGLLLMLALDRVHALVTERERRAGEAQREIAGSFGGAQRLSAPLLLVPQRRADADAEAAETAIAPLRQETSVTLSGEKRRRGLFEAVVYRAEATLTGRFQLDALAEAGLPAGGLDWAQASLFLPLEALKSLRGEPRLEVNGRLLKPMPSRNRLRGNDQGLQWRLPTAPAEATGALDYRLTLTLAGSDRLDIDPLAQTNRISVTGDWPTPGFAGAFLPDERSVDGETFRALWTVSALSSGIAGLWPDGKAAAADLAASTLSLSLWDPDSGYRLIDRATKYGMLFVGATFLLLFLFEAIGRRAIHPIQYALVGIALVLFFLTLLALSEQLPFLTAYGLAAAIVVTMVTTYGACLVRSRLWTLGLAALNLGLYGLLFVLLQQRDHALLLGTGFLLLALAGTMALTRNVDWYQRSDPASAARSTLPPQTSTPTRSSGPGA